ncbi:hypothetical protein [Catellatospora sichuanensis]|uniref:hypothetical protein n=1 Tax=Catellatospora sichuanensis TaxID=1969805 RepID=UPI001183DA0F|nr:hypothetical protein [Catellatospora sichuanensis]
MWRKRNFIDSDKDVAGYHRKSSWWQRTSAYVAELQAQLNTSRTRDLTTAQQRIADKADTHLQAARDVANKRRRLLPDLAGSDIDRAFANIHRAEIKILRLAPPEELAEMGPYLVETGKQHLRPSDQRLVALEGRLNENGYKVTEDMRELAVSVLLASQVAEEQERAQARSFRNILLASILVTATIAVLFIFWAYQDPIPIASKLCFTPEETRVVCPIGDTPSGQDVLLVEAFGAGAAALAAAISLRGIQGTSTPYWVPLMLVLLRLPVGALTALMGLVLVHGGFVPGLSNLDSSAQILAWAVIFGVAQESVTRLVDVQGRKVLDNVRGPQRDGESALMPNCPLAGASRPLPDP